MSTTPKKPHHGPSAVAADQLKNPQKSEHEATQKEPQVASANSLKHRKDTPKAQTAPQDSQTKQSHNTQTIETLTQALQTMKTETETWKTRCARSQAETDNMRKRAAHDVTKARQFGTQRLIESMLPVLDSLEKGVENCTETVTAHELSAPLAEGLKLTFNLLIETLEKEGVKRIHPLHEPFDPHFHEAISTEDGGKHPAKTVTQVLQTGYALNGRSIRPALVMVAK